MGVRYEKELAASRRSYGIILGWGATEHVLSFTTRADSSSKICASRYTCPVTFRKLSEIDCSSVDMQQGGTSLDVRSVET